MSGKNTLTRTMETANTNQVVVINTPLFETGAQTIVNTVNCVAVMGKGVALRFKNAYPEMFRDYVRRCRRKEVKPGVPYLWVDPSGQRIVLFPTKDHWRNDSRIEWIDSGLQYLAAHIRAWGITSLALPPLGCGNGSLDWRVVRPLIEERLGHGGIPVWVCIN
jgi:O-acetyl-ADP-ribose deacetylase (regulator of RNase III)